MAGTSHRRMNGPRVPLALATLLCTLAFHSGVLSQDATDTADEVGDGITIITVPPDLEEFLRGDDNPLDDITDDAGAVDPGDVPTTLDTADPDGGDDDGSDAAAGDAEDAIAPTPEDHDPQGAVTFDPQFNVDIMTIFGPMEVVTVRVPGDVVHEVIVQTGDIQCVDKEALQDRDAVKLKLKDMSSCEETKAKFKELMGELCGPDCDIKIYQEDSSAQIIVSGDNVEADAKGMAGKFTSQGIREKLGVVEATPRWGKHPPTVLVALLLTGLLLAALLIGGYCYKNHRGQQTKSARLEPQEKPSANGESPEGVKTEAPPTNGHSATKTPVADTEL